MSLGELEIQLSPVENQGSVLTKFRSQNLQIFERSYKVLLVVLCFLQDERKPAYVGSQI